VILMRSSGVGYGFVCALVAVSVVGCGGDAEDIAADAEPVFRGYTESVGIVFEATRRWTNVARGRARAIQDETEALHYSVAVLGISLMPWKEERKTNEVADLKRQMAAALALNGTRSEAAWEAYLEERASDYERGLPTPRESWLHLSPAGWGHGELQLSEAQLRQIGRIFVDGVRAHPDAPGDTPEDLEAWALSAGDHFRSRLDQLMQVIEGVPG